MSYTVFKMSKEEEEAILAKYEISQNINDLSKLFLAMYGIIKQKVEHFVLAQGGKVTEEDFIQDVYTQLVKRIHYYKKEMGRFSTFIGLIVREVKTLCLIRHVDKINLATVSIQGLSKELFDDENFDFFSALIDEDLSKCPLHTVQCEESIKVINKIISRFSSQDQLIWDDVIVKEIPMTEVAKERNIALRTINRRMMVMRNKLKEERGNYV